MPVGLISRWGWVANDSGRRIQIRRLSEHPESSTLGAGNIQGSQQILGTSCVCVCVGGGGGNRRLAKTKKAPVWPAHEGLLCTQATQNPVCALLIGRTFSRWMSLLIWEILIFKASSSSSGTTGMLGTASNSSTVWKLRSVSGMYHLQSYCWVFLEWRGTRALIDRPLLLCFWKIREPSVCSWALHPLPTPHTFHVTAWVEVDSSHCQPQ